MDILIKGNIQGIGNELTIAPENIEFTKITKSSLRLIVNETTGKVLYRHMAHDNITDISYDDENGQTKITFSSSVPVMTITDVFSVKLYVQKEDIIPTDYAKETSISYNIQQITDLQGYLQNSIAKEITLGAAPIGSERTTVFQYLAAILDNVERKGGENIPEGLGDRINLLLKFFGLPGALPEGYEFMTPEEVCSTLEDIMTAMDLELTQEMAAGITNNTLTNALYI